MHSAVRTLRGSLFACAFALVCAAAFAQGPAGSEPAKPMRAALEKRFAEADTNGDGRLSRDEAKAKMPRIYAHFDEIDAAHAGSISLQDIEAWLVKQRQARKGKS